MPPQARPPNSASQDGKANDRSPLPAGKRLKWWIATTVFVLAGVLGWLEQVSARKIVTPHSSAHRPTQASPHTQAMIAAEQARREYVLEVIGLGVTLDNFRQGALWDELKQGRLYSSIREQDPNAYPWSAIQKRAVELERQGNTLENGAKFTPAFWGVPVFNAEAPARNLQSGQPNPHRIGVAGNTAVSGMAFHLFLAGPGRFAERPDHILEDVFDFFDANPEVPYVVLNSHDGGSTRDEHRPNDAPARVIDGNYVPDMPDSSTLLVLARRERAGALRALASDAPAYNDLSRKLFEHYWNTQHSRLRGETSSQRQPTIDEWHKEVNEFTRTHRPSGMAILTAGLGPINSLLQTYEYKPTPWFPLPWSKEQLAAFDKLPSLGFIHRPVFIKTVDRKGAPLRYRGPRTAALKRGWQHALKTLPEAERQTAPARVITATGGDYEQSVAMHSMLDQWAARFDYELETAQPDQWVNTDARLGNTGASTLFMQLAIGVMGSYREGGISAAINLRDRAEASIIFITPPPDSVRIAQQHPVGGDVLQDHSTPATDPPIYLDTHR